MRVNLLTLIAMAGTTSLARAADASQRHPHRPSSRPRPPQRLRRLRPRPIRAPPCGSHAFAHRGLPLRGPSAQVSAEPAPPPAQTGQWVNTSQYGWVYAPTASNTPTSRPTG